MKVGHLNWMKIATAKVRSDGALGAVVNLRLSLTESGRFRRGCQEAGMCQSRSFSFMVVRSLCWGVSLSALVSFVMCISFRGYKDRTNKNPLSKKHQKVNQKNAFYNILTNMLVRCNGRKKRSTCLLYLAAQLQRPRQLNLYKWLDGMSDCCNNYKRTGLLMEIRMPMLNIYVLFFL
jgi:hypothetical protein